ncbi:DUF4124 domain-containing protein [Marinobacter confluentis]|uniref:DUF4124 domain-containing protein n=1 Tax=Marinobacter confluentis TaxID=1697557 RepID=A0A4Z1BUZ6_9GAMM|nr:DUF4124 domain-containing protein [Marinobacter confluentis]TGN38437.1 DUF4124 domain-containing protein [Marinobacter confluentis]
MNRKILALAVCIMVIPASASAQSVYKWTDENGIVHFGDRAPSGTESESVSIRTGKRAGSGDSDSASPQQRVQQMDEQAAQSAEREQLSAAEEARQKQRAANCQTARSNLSLIRSGSRIRVEENGEERYLTEEEKAEKREQFEEIAELNCNEETQQ